MNEAGKQFEFAVAYSRFWDRFENASGLASLLILTYTIGYISAALIAWWMK